MMHPTGVVAPNFYGLSKVHKRDILLRSIAYSKGTTTYEGAGQGPEIFGKQIPYHIKNTKGFVDHVCGIEFQQGQCVSSYDVSALFTSVPTDPAINIIIIRRKLDQELQLTEFP